jgi:hypothetical protein
MMEVKKCKNFIEGEKSCKKSLPLNHKGNCNGFERKGRKIKI